MSFMEYLYIALLGIVTGGAASSLVRGLLRGASGAPR